MNSIYKNLFPKDEANRVLIITIVINLFLVVLKLWAGYTANSKALIADGLHSASDVVTSFGIILGLAVASKPRDESHQYGHEKVETMVTFLLSIVLLYTGFRIGIGSIFSIAGGEAVVPTKLALYAAMISIILKEFQYQITLKVGKKINSDALIASAWHHRSDALSSIASLIGVVGARLGLYILDPLAGLIVSIIVVKIGFDIFKNCFQELIDVSVHPGKLEQIINKIREEKHVQYINDIRTRKHGSKVFVDVKICIDPYMEVYKGHEVAEKVEEIIKSELNNVKDIVVHLDPCFHPGEGHETCEKEKCKHL